VYFRYNPDENLEAAISILIKKSRDQLSARRNEIAHGIVGPYSNVALGKTSGFVLHPAYYATRKRDLPETGPLSDMKLRYIYSSVEIGAFGDQFSKLADAAIDILTDLTRKEQGRVT
jgi:hypothetical protein